MAYACSIGFLLAYAIPCVLIACIWIGRSTAHVGTMVYAPLLLGYVVVPMIQWRWPYVLPPVPASIRNSARWQAYHRLLLLLALPVQLAMLAVATDAWTTLKLGIAGRFGLVLTTGIFSAMFAINIGHHLIHRRNPFDRALGGVLLSTVGFGSFKIVHLRVHHRHVGTKLDFGTPRRGQSIYAFWRQCFVGNFALAARVEWQRLARTGRGIWQSELAAWSAWSLLWLMLAAIIWGWLGVTFLALQALLAIMKLDCINYLQHYGLTRKIGADGQPEPVGPQHAWTQALFLHDLVLLNLPRHSDHHVNPERSFELLTDRAEAPRYPYNYAIMNGLALFPPLFRRIVHPYLDRFSLRNAP